MSTSTTTKSIETMFSVGAHFGLGRSRRHPSAAKYIFGTKNRTDIFDLEKTVPMLDAAKAFVSGLAKEGKTVLFVGGKKEASAAIKAAAQSVNMPYVDGRWIGGTITNAGQIRKRIERYEKLVADKESGELAKYTKRERMLIDKEIASLEKIFMGIVSMKKLPDALFVVDPRREKNAVAEAAAAGIPVVALAGSDCDMSVAAYPIAGNDSAKASVQLFVDEIAKAYQDGKKAA
ncbi:MAG: 30S ribosomal protein S2 [Patescibacteria group bacterium]|nr:30S ribosomal protein S2 [Patescibacteria group bacterium]